jgi:hypothetical protein
MQAATEMLTAAAFFQHFAVQGPSRGLNQAHDQNIAYQQAPVIAHSTAAAQCHKLINDRDIAASKGKLHTTAEVLQHSTSILEHPTASTEAITTSQCRMLDNPSQCRHFSSHNKYKANGRHTSQDALSNTSSSGTKFALFLRECTCSN